MASMNEDISIFCGAYPKRCALLITSLILQSALSYIRRFLSRKYGMLEGEDFSFVVSCPPRFTLCS